MPSWLGPGMLEAITHTALAEAHALSVCHQDGIRGSYADSLALGSAIHQIVAWQMHRGRQAVAALQDAADSVHVRDLHRQLSKCVAVAVSLEEALHRLLQVKALATVVDAVDALCMHSAAVVAIAESGHLLQLPRMLLFLSHLQTCMRAVLLRVEDPVAEPLIRYRTPRAHAAVPHATSAANPVHLWYLSIVWLRSRLAHSLATEPLLRRSESLDGDGSGGGISGAHLGDAASTGLDGTAGADAEAALDVLHAHTAALMAKRRRRHKSRNADAQSHGFATSTGGLSTVSNTTMTATFDCTRSEAAAVVNLAAVAESELLLYAAESGLTPAAALEQPVIWQCCAHLFLNAEFMPFGAVFSALEAGLQSMARGAGCGRAQRGVRDAARALELLTASRSDIRAEVAAYSEAAVGVFQPPHKYAGDADPALQPLVPELLSAQQRIIGDAAAVYVGALARAFPVALCFEDCITVLVDLARSRPTPRRNAAAAAPLDSVGGGGTSPVAASLQDWHSEGGSRALRVPGSARCEPLGAPGTAAGTAFYSPHTSLTSEPDAWMTAASAPSMAIDVPPRPHEVANLLALHGGWHAAQPDLGGVGGVNGLLLVEDSARKGEVAALGPHGRAEEVACIVSEVDAGTGLIAVTGVRGIGKTLTLQQATVQLLQARTWLDTAYVRLSEKQGNAMRALAELLHCSVAATAPPEHLPQRLARSLSSGQRCGLVVDNVRNAAVLEKLVPWARKLRHHAPALQVLFGVRSDAGFTPPDGVRHVPLSPLRDAVADSLLERSVLLHAHRRLSIPLPEGSAASVMHDSDVSESAAWGAEALGVTERDTQSVGEPVQNGAAEPPKARTTPAVPDLTTVTQPALALAREGLRLCRGVPLLLHVLLQVAVVCVLTPQAHDTSSTFKANLQVLQRSMAAPLRLTSLVVKQVHSCLTAQLSQPGMARFLVSGVQILRILETCPVLAAQTPAVPPTVPLAREAVDDESSPLLSGPPPVLTTPIGHFATATVLLQSGHVHSAHALMQRHAGAVIRQVAALKTGAAASATEEALSWLHAALTILGGHLLAPEQLADLIAALQGLGKQSVDASVLAQSCMAWLLVEDGKPEAALAASPAAVQPATLPASTKFTVAHVRAVALARFSMLQQYVGDAGPALHQALDRLNRAIAEANADLPQLALNAEARAGPLQSSALRACATASPFAQAPITALIRALVLKELATVHQHIGNVHATAHLRAVLLALCNAGSDAAERHLGGYGGGPVGGSESSDAGAPPFAEAELTAVQVNNESPALRLVLSLDVLTGVSMQRAVPARADPPCIINCLAQPPRPLMQGLSARLCEAEAAGAPDCAQQAAWLLRGLAELAPQLRSIAIETAVCAAGARPANHVLQTAHRDALRRALFTGGGGGSNVVRMLIGLARAAHLEWPTSGLGRDAALAAAMLLANGHLRPMPGARAAWDMIAHACHGRIDADAASILQRFGVEAESMQLLATPRLSALNSCRSLEVPEHHPAPSAAAQADGDSPRHFYARRPLPVPLEIGSSQVLPSAPQSMPERPRGASQRPTASPRPSAALISEVSLAHALPVPSSAPGEITARRRLSADEVTGASTSSGSRGRSPDARADGLTAGLRLVTRRPVSDERPDSFVGAPSLRIPTGSTVSTPVAFNGTVVSGSTVDISDVADPSGMRSLDSPPSAGVAPSVLSGATDQPSGAGDSSQRRAGEVPAASAPRAAASEVSEASIAVDDASAALVARSPSQSSVDHSIPAPQAHARSGGGAAAPSLAPATTDQLGGVAATDLRWAQPGDAELTSSSVPLHTLPDVPASAARVTDASHGASGAPSAPAAVAAQPHTASAVASRNAEPPRIRPDELTRESVSAHGDGRVSPPSSSRGAWPVVSTTLDGLCSESDTPRQLALPTQRPRTMLGSPFPPESWDQTTVASSASLVLDSQGHPTACLRNQPRLPRTAFLSQSTDTNGTAMLALSSLPSSATEVLQLSTLQAASPLSHATHQRTSVQTGSTVTSGEALLRTAGLQQPSATADLFGGIMSPSHRTNTSSPTTSAHTSPAQSPSPSPGRSGYYPNLTPRRLPHPCAATVTTGTVAPASVAAAATRPLVTTGANKFADTMLAAFDLASPRELDLLGAAIAATSRPAQTVTTGAVAASSNSGGSWPASPRVERPTVTTGGAQPCTRLMGSGTAGRSSPTATTWASSITSGSVPDRPASASATFDARELTMPHTVTTGALPGSPLRSQQSASAPPTRPSSPVVPRLPLHTITTGVLTSQALSSELLYGSQAYASTCLSSATSSAHASTTQLGVNGATVTSGAVSSADLPRRASAGNLAMWGGQRRQGSLHGAAATSLSALLSPRFDISEAVVRPPQRPIAPPRLSSSDLFARPDKAAAAAATAANVPLAPQSAPQSPSQRWRSPLLRSPRDSSPMSARTASPRAPSDASPRPRDPSPPLSGSGTARSRGADADGASSAWLPGTPTSNAGTTLGFGNSAAWDLSGSVAPSSYSGSVAGYSGPVPMSHNPALRSGPRSLAPTSISSVGPSSIGAQSNTHTGSLAAASVAARKGASPLAPISVSRAAVPSTRSAAPPVTTGDEPSSPALSSLHSTPRGAARSPQSGADAAHHVRMFSNPAADPWPSTGGDADSAFAQRSMDVAMVDNPAAERVTSDAALTLGAPTLMQSISGGPAGLHSDSEEDTVSIQMPRVADSGDCAGGSSISVAKLVGPRGDIAKASSAAHVGPSEPRIPYSVGEKDCTLDFAIGGGTPPKGTDVDAANASFRRWEAAKAARETRAPTSSYMPPPPRTPPRARDVAGTSLRACVSPPTASSVSPQDANTPAATAAAAPAAEPSSVPTHGASASTPDSSGAGAAVVGVVPDAAVSSFMSGFELGGESALSIGGVGMPSGDAANGAAARNDSIMSSLHEPIKWLDNGAAEVWRENPLGEEASHDRLIVDPSEPSPVAEGVPLVPLGVPQGPPTPQMSPGQLPSKSRIPRISRD